jgi:hypothetical protein
MTLKLLILNSGFQIPNHKPHRVYGPELYVVQGSRFQIPNSKFHF